MTPRSAIPAVIATAAIVACVALLVVPVAAVDGEILIDQGKVNAGGITPGDAPGFPATLSRPGRYKLSGNLKVPAGFNGIEVTQHNVTIDFNGFTISSNPPGEAFYGVFAVNVSGLQVMNGTIADMRFYGIYNPESAFAVVENMRIVSNGGGVLAEMEARIGNSTIADGGVGIVCSSRCLIGQNIVSGNATDAAVVQGGATVLGNAIVANKGFGLFSGAVSAGYGNNLLFGNTGGGAQVGGPVLQLHPNVCIPACP